METNELVRYFDAQPAIVDRNLEISMFSLRVECAPWPFPDDFKIQYSNIVYQAIFDIISKAGIAKSGLSFTSPKKALEVNKLQGEGTTGWFGISYRQPGKEFGITVDDSILQIRCSDILLEDLVELADQVFSKITEAWCSETLAQPAKLEERAHTVDYSFDINIRLGNDKVQQKLVPNYELITEALSLKRSPKGKGTVAIAEALPVLGIEKYIRMDFTQHALKELDNHKFNTGFVIEAPFNENNSILSLRNFLRMEDDFEFNLSAALNWQTALISFYRELVLKRFLENLLCSTEFTYK
jgi:hypothetical protein